MTTTMHDTDRYAHVNGLRLRYRDTGPVGAPPVVMLHGIMGHVREWDIVRHALSTRHRVIAVDQRGHGHSDWAGEYSTAAMAADVEQLITQLHLTGVNLVGHSMGAMNAMVCAAARPDLVDRLVIIDVAPDSLMADDVRHGLADMLTELSRQSFAHADEAVGEWMAGNPRAREPLMRHYVTHALTTRADGRLVWRFDAAGLARFPLHGVDAAQLWHAVRRIAAPTLVVRGADSWALPAAEAEQVLHRLRDGRLVEIAGGGHDLGVEQPEAVAAAVAAFLDP